MTNQDYQERANSERTDSAVARAYLKQRERVREILDSHQISEVQLEILVSLGCRGYVSRTESNEEKGMNIRKEYPAGISISTLSQAGTKLCQRKFVKRIKHASHMVRESDVEFLLTQEGQKVYQDFLRAYKEFLTGVDSSTGARE